MSKNLQTNKGYVQNLQQNTITYNPSDTVKNDQ